MNSANFVELLLFIFLLIFLTPILGSYLCKILNGESTPFSFFLKPLENLIYRITGVEEKYEMNWKSYLVNFLVFHFIGFIVLSLILVFQGSLPLNPQKFAGLPLDLALNTSMSFITNTNWQAYSGESQMSYLSQMMGLSVQNFLSAACGIAVAFVFIRGISRKNTQALGNFWVDITKITLYVLMPICVIYTLFLVSQGVIQNFSSYMDIQTLEGAKQTVPFGPVASQVAIKMFGTNGGGFFNANAAHPFENSTPFSNFIQMLSIFAIGAALTFTYGQATRSKKHGWILFAVMMFLFLVMTGVSVYSEYTLNPNFNLAGLMEGKEQRFGVFDSVLFSSITTSASCGAVNAMHSSLSPLSGGVALLNMMIGEIIFGGVGAGLYGMILFVILTVFIAGLMVGRTPEYMGKKIESKEMIWVILAILAPCAVILVGTAISVLLPNALASLSAKGPHGFSEILYAFTSTAANNGSAFAGLNANTMYYNLFLMFAMFIGRFAVVVPVLAISGSLSQKKYSPPSAGTFQTDSFIFAVLLVGVILIVSALTFLPSLALGPIVEHLLMLKGQTF